MLSSIQAGSWCEACEPYTIKDIDVWLESDAHIQGNAFWLKVEGDSMTAPVGLSIPEEHSFFSIPEGRRSTAAWS